MTDRIDTTNADTSATFAWHPDYIGRSVDSVRRELMDCINRDKQSYYAALESAEKEEHGAFNTVRDLEKRWSQYDFAWHELPAERLADRIVEFERARDDRKELVEWNAWKSERHTTPVVAATTGEKQDWRENLTDEQRRKIASALAIAIMVGILLLCIGLYLIVR